MTLTTKPVRIGNAQAFWGDRANAAAEMLAREPDLDYLTMDYLAEVSMSILAMQRERDSAAGFARDFIDVIRSLAPYWSVGGDCRLITNAGGLNPRGCAEACRKALSDLGCRSLRVAAVTGDDVFDMFRNADANLSAAEFSNLDSGAAIAGIRDRLVTANAYLGAAPIIEALEGGADIVVTGRVADPSLTVAPCLHHFGWNINDLDRLAGATVAGHLIECGTQVTGGISTDWLDVPDAAHIGFPIVEVASDGSCIVTKPRGTGGSVTSMTVKEQLLYEIGDPDNYLSPDVAVSFLSLAVEDLGNDRVRVSGAVGKPRPEMYKVSATYRDGFWSAGAVTIIGRNAEAKARYVGEMVFQRVREANYELRDTVIECLGCGAAAGGIVDHRGESEGFAESVLRVAVESESYDGADCFSREIMPFITAGPQGTTGYSEGRPRVHPVFRYWPSLIARGAVDPHVEIIACANGSRTTPRDFAGARLPATATAPTSLASNDLSVSARSPTHLYDIACARSGDKGCSANIGVIARSPNCWEFMRTWLSTDVVAEYFAPLGVESIDRYELPNLGALNFVLHGVLKQSLRTDAQGKALGQILLEMQLPVDAGRRIATDNRAAE